MIIFVVSVVVNELMKLNEYVLIYVWKVFNDIYSGVCEI